MDECSIIGRRAIGVWMQEEGPAITKEQRSRRRARKDKHHANHKR